MNTDFYKGLPQKRMASGALLFNDSGEFLLLKPTYKDVWLIPGGVTEENESPKLCCKREIKEELGLDINIGRLLVVDYNSYPEEPEKTEALMFVFDAGVLKKEEINSIVLQQEEASEYGFFAKNNLPKLSSSLHMRIQEALLQLERYDDPYRENSVRV